MNKTFYLSENFSLDTKKRLLKIILNGKGKYKCYIPESYYELLNVFQSSSSLKGSLFKGLTFYIYNFDKVKKNRLEKIILIQQGSIYNPDTLFNANDELLIVTSFTKKFDPSIIGKFSIKTRVITNYWVEKCFLKKKIYDFDKYPMFIPCSLENGINGNYNIDNDNDNVNENKFQ
ncbi:hypothetical protein BCR32DRAFT_249662 [Anaeromyces robustus]|uniref:BRCT domain-containing protein n=1 Tax=Anaeromyces robustus TaxID=1754192 RepID=A0A1Y1WP55_9FUNG|nr:hypothetical protein BCR32DRAFT_249662 [Anaeromyces robustus]|eukprot:ORX75317.1 hypothetical protein BCR32DRAFT_249662 [Anaeromyces robustus]